MPASTQRTPRLLRRELMDEDRLPAAENERALLDLQRVNRWTLGLGAVLRTLAPLLAAGPPRPWLLDLGTGTGQVPAALARDARRRRIDLRVVGVDRKLGHLVCGQRQGFRQHRVAAAADALPFREGAVDWSISSLLFHHFTPEANRRILAEMRRVARRAAVVVDLRRSRVALFLIRLLLPLLGADHVARHDGRVSVEQAWTVDEVVGLLDGECVVELRRRFPFRFSLVLAERRPEEGRPPDDAAGPVSRG